MIWGYKNRMKKLEAENRIEKMSPNELQNLASTSQLIGQVIFASLFVEPISLGNLNAKGLIAGLILSGGFLYVSFFLAKKVDSKL
jgi:hypothetical protein